MDQNRPGRITFGSLVMGVLLLAAGCQTPESTKQPLLLFPAPPERPRIQFLTWASGAEQVEPARGALDEFLLGDEPSVRERIQKPFGLAARDGAVYVCDTKGLALCRLDFKKHTFSILGARGPGRLRKPINVVIDPLGYKFVVDPLRKQVVVFGPDDEYATAFDVPLPSHPVDVAVHENELYVLDNDDTPQVIVMDRTTGEVLRTFGEAGAEHGQFKKPASLAIGPEGYLYVCDTHNWRIQKLDLEGHPIWVRGAPGYRLGRFGRPRGLRVGPDGVIYVVDASTEIVQMLNADGETLMHFGGPGNVPGALLLPSTLAIDASSIPYFQKYIHKDFNAEYLLFVASQYGSHLVSVYAFGSFPEGFQLSESAIATLPTPEDRGIPPVSDAEAPGPAREGDQAAETQRAEDRD